MKKISIIDLEISLNKLIRGLKEEGITNIEIHDDYYWNVRMENLTTFPNQPELTVGSLKDDLEFLFDYIKDEDSINFLVLNRLSSIFKILSKSLN